MEQAHPFPRALARPRWPVVAAATAGLAVWLFWLGLTPSGLLGKADAIGYAVCHRIDARSFHLGDRQLPLCARCTGIYLGAMLGFLTLAAAGRTRAAGLPSTRLILTLVGFIAVMGVDGVNSYLSFFPQLPHLYPPQNWLRLITGTLAGLAISMLVFPSFNQTVWRHWEDRPALASFRELLGLLLLAGILIGLVLAENPLALYPLALLSSLGVLALLGSVHTIMLLLLFRRENRAEGWRGAALPALGGLTLGLVQIGLFDLLRFVLTGTWAGFSL